MGAVAKRLGTPFMPWQQHVADVALEVDPVTGRLAYTEMGLTVPRQSGKSTWLLAKAVHRASATSFFGARQRIVYTAQTRLKAREKWEEDYASALENSRTYGSKIVVHRGNGNEHIRFANGSRFGIEANTEKAGHGGTLDEAYIDEAFSQVDFRLEQAFRPAMITRANKLLGWVSTAGWKDGSPFLQEKVRKGREAVEQDSRRALCYFEWSADEKADPTNRDVWRACMPALGHTIDEEAIAGELKALGLQDFRRAYLNQWVARDLGAGSVIDLVMWGAIADPSSEPDGPVAIAVDVNPERSAAAVALAGVREDGQRHAELWAHRPGTGWVAEVVADLVADLAPVSVAVASSGPAASLVSELQEAGVEVDMVGPGEESRACGALFDAVMRRELVHSGAPEVLEALKAATKRDSGDGGWTWSRKRTDADISPLVALTLSLYAHSVGEPTGGWMVGV